MHTIRKLAVGVMCLALALSEVVVAQDHSGDFRIEAMPFAWASALRAALHEFEKIQIRDRACYSINVVKQGGELLIEFSPAKTPEESSLRGGATKCGPAVAYLVDSSGKVTKSTFYR